MAVDMFLELDGIKGESKDKKHAGLIDILAWSWGVSNSGTMHAGGGGGSGKANFQDLSVTKYVDKASASLLAGAAKGTHIKKGKLIVRKAGDKPLEYIIISLEEIMVSALSTGGSGGEDRLTENVTLNFAKIKFEYKVQKPDGSGEAGGDFSWDIPANSP